MAGNIKIEFLADHPHVIPTLRSWFEHEWAQYYGADGPGDAEHDLQESCQHEALPLALVAFADGELCGTAALKKVSVTTHTHLTPWLSALLVEARFRRRGIAEHLIAAIEATAHQLGFTCIYVGTGEGSGTPQTALRKRGWEFVEKGPYFVSEVSIFKKRL